jgi:NAD(P)H dehydrogenase (quinone)
MRIHIVSAYPEQESFGGQVFNGLRASLRARGHEVAVSDLPRMRFPAILNARQFGGAGEFFDVQAAQEQAQRAGTVHKDVAREQDKVRAADAVVFLTPIYWSSPPAMLRGWMEQVFAPGFAYERGKIFEAGLLKGRSAMFAVTHAGKLGAATEEGARVRAAKLLEPLAERPLRYIGMRVLPPVSLCPPSYKDVPARAQAIDDVVAQIVARVEAPVPAAAQPYPLISLHGRPGVGKKTVAGLLAGMIDARLVDNHAILNVGTTACGRSTPGYYRVNRAVRAAVFAELADELTRRPVILTNALAVQIPEHHEVIADIGMMAKTAGAPLYDVVLTASFNENAQRVQAPGRAEHGKLTSPEMLAKLYEEFDIIEPEGARVIDTTGRPAICTARMIRDSLPERNP